jgi:glycosyltransferase involved in cell wall biosynthesis
MSSNLTIDGRRAEPKTLLAYIPHGIDTKKFYPVTADDTEGQDIITKIRQETLQGLDIDFMVFYNARNLRRKMTSDVLLAYNHFLQQLTPEEQEKCRIVLHTQPVDDNGTDLLAVIRDVVPNIKAIFSNNKVDHPVLNALYNMADVTINLANNEGFGLGTAESLLAGTPILVNVTGGLQDQCGFRTNDGRFLTAEDYVGDWMTNADGSYRNHGEWAFPVFPVSRSLQGSPATPYIFDDRCDWKEAGDKLLELYRMGRGERKRRGEAGRQFALTDGMLSADKMGELFIDHINKTLEAWTPRDRYTLVGV